MSVQAPIDPPDGGMFEDSEWECPSCGDLTYCTVSTELTGLYEAEITTICNSCNYTKFDTDYSYGYNG